MGRRKPLGHWASATLAGVVSLGLVFGGNAPVQAVDAPDTVEPTAASSEGRAVEAEESEGQDPHDEDSSALDGPQSSHAETPAEQTDEPEASSGFSAFRSRNSVQDALDQASSTNPDGNARQLRLRVTTVQDGTADFDSEEGPGLDGGPNNGIVRVNDVVTYNVEYNAAVGQANNFTLKVVFPKGLYLTELPGYCVGQGSSLSPVDPTTKVTLPLSADSHEQLEQQTLVCNVGQTAAAAQVVKLSPRVSNLIHHNATLTLQEASASADGVPEIPAETQMPSVRTSAALNWDLSKTSMADQVDSSGFIDGYAYGAFFEPCFWDNSRECFNVRYNITMSAPAGGKGVMPAVGDVTFVEDLSFRSLYPNLKEEQYRELESDKQRYGARVTEGYGYYAIPGGKIGRDEGGLPATAVNSVRDTGTLVIDKSAEPGSPVTMTVRNADFSLHTYPKEAIRPVNTKVPANKAYAVSMPVTVHFPAETVRKYGEPVGVGKRLVAHNTFKDLRVQGFEPTDVQTGEKFLPNNTLRKFLEIKPPYGLSKYFGGAIGHPLNTHRNDFAPFNGWLGDGPPGGHSHRSGNIGAAARQEVVGILLMGGASPLFDFTGSTVVCDAWDNTKLHLKEKNWEGARYTTREGLPTGFGRGVPSEGKAVWITGYNNVLAPSGKTAMDAINADQVPELKVQYAAAPGNAAADVTCGNDKGPWYDNPADVPGNDQAKAAEGVYTGVGRVRAYFVSPKVVGKFGIIGSGYFITLGIGYEVAENLKTGTVIPNWASMKRLVDTQHQIHTMEELLSRTDVPWTENTYNPQTHAGGAGDRLIAADVFARVNKRVRKGESGSFTNTPPVTTGGDKVQYEITATLSSASLIPDVRDTLWVEDCLPDASAYVSATPAPQIIALEAPSDARRTCDNGTYLRWEFPHVEANTAIDPIILTTEVLQTAADGSYVNQVQVWAAKDTSPVTMRESNASIKVNNAVGLKLSKKALTPVVQLNHQDAQFKEENRWLIDAANTATPQDLNIEGAVVIDVLPKNAINDNDYEGDFVFSSMTPDSANADQWIVEYTKTPTAELNADPKHTSNQPSGTTLWCGGEPSDSAAPGCPTSKSEVTGIRVTLPGVMQRGDRIKFVVGMTASGNSPDANYVNVVGASAASLGTSIGPLKRQESTVVASVADRFFIDSNGNGVEDQDEPGVPNAKVQLTGVDDLGNPVDVTVTTEPDGSYVIPNLRASNAAGYTVTFTIPDELKNDKYEFTTTATSPASAKIDKDSNPDGAGVASGIVLAPGEARVDIDAGIVKPSINLVKSISHDEVRVNDEVTYTFTATNNGSAVLHDVTLTEDAFTNGAGQPITLTTGPTFDPTKSTGTVESMAPGATVVWTGTYRVKAADVVLDKTIDNSATVKGKSPRDTEVRAQDDEKVPPFDDGTYKIAKTSNPAAGAIDPGTDITYTIVVRHVGNLTVKNASLEDDLTNVLTDASAPRDVTVTTEGGTGAQPGVATVQGNKLVWNGDLVKDQEVTIKYTVTSKVGTKNRLKNVVIPTNPKGSCDDEIGCTVDHSFNPGKFTVRKDAEIRGKAGTVAQVGDIIDYTVTVKHSAGTKVNAAIRDDLTDVLDDGELVGDPVVEPAQGTPVVDQKAITWQAVLMPQQQVKIKYSVRVTGNNNLTLTNTVTPSNKCGTCEGGVENCTTTHTTPKGKYQYSKTSPTASPVKSGQEIQYTVTVKHTEGAPVKGAEIRDELPLPDNTRLVGEVTTTSNKADIVNPATVTDTNVLTWKGNLVPEEVITISYKLHVDVNNGATLRNVVTSPDPDGERHSCEPKEGEDDKCETLHEVVKGKYHYWKTSNPADTSVVKTGNKILYTLHIGHNGGDRVKNAVVEDDLTPLLANATYAGDAAVTNGVGALEADPQRPNVIIWKGDLTEGETAEVTIPVTVTATNGATLTNTLTSPDPDKARHQCKDGVDKNCTVTHTQEKGAFVYSKTAHVGDKLSNNGAVRSGDRIDYTITVKHTSGDAIPGAKISDAITSILANAEGKALVADSLVATSTANGAPAQPVLGDDKVITWTGDLAEHEVVTIKYSIIVDAAGSATLTNAVTTPAGEDRGSCDTTEGMVCQTSNSVEGGKYAYSKTSDVQELVTGVAGKEGRVVSGTKITYTLNVAHKSGDRIKGATITDNFSDLVKTEQDQTKPAKYNDDAQIVSGPGEINVENNVLTWTGDLAEGASTVITFSVTVDADGSADLLNKVVSNDPQTGRHSCVDPTDEDKDPCQTRHIVEQGKYLVTKTGVVKNGDTVKPGSSAVAGDDIVYTLTATHRSGDRVKDAGFSDDFASILEHVDFKSATLEGPGTLSLNDQNAPTSLSWAGTLEPGQSATVTLTVTVKAATQVDKFTNTVTPKPGDPRGECPEGECSVDNNVPDGKFVVKKSSATGSPVKTDDKINYTIVVKHSEGTRIVGASVEDTLPAGVVYNDDAVASSGAVKVVDGKLQWTGDLAVGQVVTIDYSVKVGAADNGTTLVNVVKPTNPKGSCEDPEDEKCTTTHSVEPGKFVFEKDATMPRVVKSGDQIDYTIVVKHKSGNSLTSAKIKDDLSSVLANAEGKKLKEGTLKTVSSVQGKTPAQASVDPAGLLTWDGSLAVDEVVTITYSVTVDAPNVGATLVNQVVPGDGETKGQCEDPEDPECKTEHTVEPGKFTVAKTQDKPRVVLSGDVITYTVIVKHTTGDRVKGAHVRDVLTRVLNAATWNGDQKVVAKFVKEGVETDAASGELTYDEATKTLDWKGDLLPNQVVTITYSVTVNAESSAQLVNVVTTPGNDGACVENCETNNEVKEGKFTVNKTQDRPAIVQSGDVITYTLKIKHKEGDRILGAQINDDLSKVLGNPEQNIPAAAKWNNDLKVSAKFIKDDVETDAPAGEAKMVNDHTLNWKGDLFPNQVVTITYSVTVDAPGAATLQNTVSTPDGKGDCEENCITLSEVPLGKYVFNKTSDPENMSEVKPGQKITYTVKIKHKEGDRVLGANVVDDLKDVLNAADWNNEVTATSVIRRGDEEREGPAGAVVFDAEAKKLNWVGNLAIGQEVTITYTVTVKENNVNPLKNVVTTPDAEERGKCEENCETMHTPAGKYAYSKTSEAASGSTVKTGDAIKYTLTVKHVSGEPVKAASIHDDLTQLLTKATYNNDAVASAGKVTFNNGVLNWTGDLAKDEVVTVVFTVKVTADGPATLVNKITSEDPEKERHSCVGPEDKDCTTTHAVEPKPAPKKPNPKGPGKLASTGMSGALAGTAALTLAGGLLFLAARRRRFD